MTACPNHGEPQFYEATLESEVPDYEEGLRMGLAAEAIAEEEEPPLEQPRFYTPQPPESAPAEPGRRADRSGERAGSRPAALLHARAAEPATSPSPPPG